MLYEGAEQGECDAANTIPKALSILRVYHNTALALRYTAVMPCAPVFKGTPAVCLGVAYFPYTVRQVLTI